MTQKELNKIRNDKIGELSAYDDDYRASDYTVHPRWQDEAWIEGVK